jgi:hypothetical protein
VRRVRVVVVSVLALAVLVPAVAGATQPSYPAGEFSDEGPRVATPSADAASYRAIATRDTGDVVDLLVAYTSKARAAAGGTVAMRDRIDRGMEEANRVLANSGVTVRLRLVGTTEVFYLETGNSNADLEAVTNPTDGKLDDLHHLRDDVGADIVTLVVSDFDAAGRGWQFDSWARDFAPYAFNVVHMDYVAANYGLIHEIGHNMGAGHNSGVDVDETRITPYAFGYRYAGVYRTVMAYPCVFPRPCPTAPYFSTPNVTYRGLPAGVAEFADNARTLNETRETVANFRLHTTPLIGEVGLRAVVPVGTPFLRRASFTDNGSVSWSATVDFADTAAPGEKAATVTSGFVDLVHAYSTVGSRLVEVCVTDGEGHTDCGFDRLLAADGFDSIGAFDPTSGKWHLMRASDESDLAFFVGNPADTPFMGDWDCDGIDTPGLYRRSDGYVYLRNSNTQGIADRQFFFGNPGDIPLVGDFDGDGCDTVSIYRPAEGRFYIINRLGDADRGLGAADFAFYFGDPGDKPFVGDLDGDGVDEVGLHRESSGFVYVRWTLSQGRADYDFFYGDPGDVIIAGDWTGDGVDTVGIFRPDEGRFYLRHSNTPGAADESFAWGAAGWVPVAWVPDA